MRLISRCPHSQKTGIYGDEINHNGGYRLRCDNCGLLLDGPVSLAQDSPHIIRTQEDLEALDADTVVISSENGEVYYVKNLTERHTKTFLYVPAVVIATGEQVRAAREALAHIPPKVVRTDSN